jgi:phage host-nuclease inhibitor protein Gam
MESPAQTCGRLLTALEDLVRQEADRLEARDFPAVAAIQERSAPLIAHLAAHGGTVADRSFRARVAALAARRGRTCAALATQLARVEEELRRIGTAQRQLARMAPAYRSPGAPAAQFSAVG